MRSRIGLIKKAFLIAVAAFTTACGNSDFFFGLSAQSDYFSQRTVTVDNKVDILWIVDGSGTMDNHQANLASNFSHFIADFTTKNLDFHMAVASTDAWIRETNFDVLGTSCGPDLNPSHNPNNLYTSTRDCLPTLATYADLTKFRDGDIYGSATGVPGVRSGNYLITSLMDPTDVMSTFGINVKTGGRGDGVQESGFQSLRAVLRRNSDGSVGYGGETHTALSNFRRNDAFLAVIIVSDEEDQSKKADGTNYASTQDYTDAFKTFLDGYTGGVEGNRHYNVSSIVITDLANCVYGLHPQATQGDRYVAVAGATKGIAQSICSPDFSSQLSVISEQILSLSSRFQLTREPKPETIVVTANGAVVPESATDGWTFISEGGYYFIQFHGAAVPPQGAPLSINYDPISIIH